MAPISGAAPRPARPPACSTRSSTSVEVAGRAPVVRVGHLEWPQGRPGRTRAGTPMRAAMLRRACAPAAPTRLTRSIASIRSKRSKSASLHLSRTQIRSGRIPRRAAARDGCARSGGSPVVVVVRAGRVDLDRSRGSGACTPHMLAEHCLGSRRATDVAHADEQDSHLLVSDRSCPGSSCTGTLAPSRGTAVKPTTDPHLH